MRVLWFGINDTNACVLYSHDLRLHLQKHHGVELIGPGYTWPMDIMPPKMTDVIEAEGKPDWIVWDECNGTGFVPMNIDLRPQGVRIAVREGDWHNTYRREVIDKLDPDVIFGAVDRKPPAKRAVDPYLFHEGFTLMPWAVNTDRFYPGEDIRSYAMVLYGQTGACYADRTKARAVLSSRKDVILPTHGGYWSDGRGSLEGVTFYNDELAALLRKCRMAWVDGSDFNVALMKYYEVAASGTLMVGKKPYAWHRYFPDGCMVVCEPEEVPDVINFYMKRERSRRSITDRALQHIHTHHTIAIRAREMMAFLEGWR
ncbi:MAG: glycosyltransferase family 1 protein [Gammaproteobacteria bacterium]|nr:glycosyltransferase family 1 protein [Gammaproteobacteria bacterium]